MLFDLYMADNDQRPYDPDEWDHGLSLAEVRKRVDDFLDVRNLWIGHAVGVGDELTIRIRRAR